MRLILACLAALFFLAFSTKVSFAHFDSFPEAPAGEITQAVEKMPHLRILPTNPLHFFIRVKENFTRFFKSSAANRAEFDLVLSGKRLKEAYLLTEENDAKAASKSLVKYSQRLQNLSQQLEKARSQNQDVLALSGKIADDLALQQRLLWAISQKYQQFQNSYNFSDNLEGAEEEFKNTVLTINNVKPGLKDRFPYLWD